MAKKSPGSALLGAWSRSASAFTRQALRANRATTARALRLAVARDRAPPGAGDWIAGIAAGAGGVRRYRLYRPPGVAFGERLPLLVMLHGCDQDAASFATSTRMNAVAARERFLVLYPEQDRLANGHGCWNWFDTRSGRAHGEASIVMAAIDQVCWTAFADSARVAVAGLSAGASMAALLAMRYPHRFRAVVMHSGVPPGQANSGVDALSAMRGHRPVAALPAAGAASGLAPMPPLLVIHGAGDRVVTASNAHAAVRLWAEAAGARAAAPREMRRGARYPMTVTDYRAGPRTIARLVEIPQLGHAWSGGAAKHKYADKAGPNASLMAWRFAAGQFAVG